MMKNYVVVWGGSKKKLWIHKTILIPGTVTLVNSQAFSNTHPGTIEDPKELLKSLLEED